MKKINNNYFRLFPCVLACAGSKKTLLADTQRHEIFSIPNHFMPLIERLNTLSLDETLLLATNEEARSINQIIDFFLRNELGFYCDNPESFPPLNNFWDYPGVISNAILEFSSQSIYEIEDVILQLQQCGCKFLELRFYYKIGTTDLFTILQLLDGTIFRNIDIVAPYSILEDKEPEIIFNTFQRLSHLILFSAQKNEFKEINQKHYITYHSGKIESNIHCGVVNPVYFNSTLELYMESQKFNSCLNRKISIDVEGNIKNCPSMSQSFGNIRDITLQEALNHPDFKKYWNVTKDQIEVCKDCEFRYICTDCRAYIENPEVMHSKPLKCGYNPYTAEWEEWSTNPLKQKAIDYYGMREILPEFNMKPDYVPSANPSTN